MIALDLSRLLSRAGRGTPTGIDRVELAYAEHLIAAGQPVCFIAMGWGRLGLLPQEDAGAFVAALAAAWRGDAASPRQDRRLKQHARRLHIALLAGGGRALYRRLRSAAPANYLLVSHHHLENERLISRLKAHTRARFICLIHDLIPIEYPEYARPGQADHHRRRIESAARLADGLIVPSRLTREALQPYLERAGRAPPIVVAPFGAKLPAVPPGGLALPERPYFVYVSTIEARKNHLLLLNLWRRLARELGGAAPLLVLIGQRGWETENVIDMLDRSPPLRDSVVEHNSLSDAEMVRLLKDARALLLPSFTEGFGFPLVEALCLGVPALCSDIPELRETGGAVPEYLDPLDGPGWRAAILAYAAPASPRREAQLRRIAGWRAAGWEDHFSAVAALWAPIKPAGRAADADAGQSGGEVRTVRR